MTLAPALAVLVSIAALYVGYRNDIETNKTTSSNAASAARIERSQEQLKRSVNTFQQFGALVHQLGASSRIERISGAYGLRDLAKDQRSLASRVVQIFAAFVRGPHQANRTDLPLFTQIMAATTREVRSRDRSHVRLDLNHAALPHMPLVGMQSEYGYFAGATFAYADLRRAQFLCANLSHADLSHAKLGHARLERVYLDSAQLQDAELSGATVRQVYWDRRPPMFPVGTRVDLHRRGGLRAFCRRCQCT